MDQSEQQIPRSGFLTIYSSDRSEIYGELSDAYWAVQETSGGRIYMFEGTAGEGTRDTFLRVDASGISNVAFDFIAGDQRFSGEATLLKPERAEPPAGAIIRIETPTLPSES